MIMRLGAVKREIFKFIYREKSLNLTVKLIYASKKQACFSKIYFLNLHKMQKTLVKKRIKKIETKEVHIAVIKLEK